MNPVSPPLQDTFALVGCLFTIILFVPPGFNTRTAIDGIIGYVQYAGLPMP